MANRSDTREATYEELSEDPRIWMNEEIDRLRASVAALEAERATLREALAHIAAYASQSTHPDHDRLHLATVAGMAGAALVSGEEVK